MSNKPKVVSIRAPRPARPSSPDSGQHGGTTRIIGNIGRQRILIEVTTRARELPPLPDQGAPVQPISIKKRD